MFFLPHSKDIFRPFSVLRWKVPSSLSLASSGDVRRGKSFTQSSCFSTAYESIPIPSQSNIHNPDNFIAFTFEPPFFEEKKHKEDFSPPIVPWFPSRKIDLNSVGSHVLEAGADLQSDHPGFSDKEYRIRRNHIADLCSQWKSGDQLPEIKYTDTEIKTWTTIYNALKQLHSKCASSSFCESFKELEENGIYRADRIPSIQPVSDFCQRKTGFTIRPVTGLLTSRDFLNALAHRAFFCTQYIRHHSAPLYTPEPDICHELLGHMPMFANTDFAEFSQMIGLASLGASDDEIVRLASCYWFTAEYGLVCEKGEVKAYGAGLLSSAGELPMACIARKEAPHLKFDPFVAQHTPYNISSYQDKYFVADSLGSVRESMKLYCENMERPFKVFYDKEKEAVTTSCDIIMVRK